MNQNGMKLKIQRQRWYFNQLNISSEMRWYRFFFFSKTDMIANNYFTRKKDMKVKFDFVN